MNPYSFSLTMALLMVATSARADCAPQSGFELARLGEPAAIECEQSEYRMAFGLGRQINMLRAEQSELSDMSDTDTKDAAARAARLRVIERELSQLEGLARIHGLLGADSGQN